MDFKNPKSNFRTERSGAAHIPMPREGHIKYGAPFPKSFITTQFDLILEVYGAV